MKTSGCLACSIVGFLHQLEPDFGFHDSMNQTHHEFIDFSLRFVTMKQEFYFWSNVNMKNMN